MLDRSSYTPYYMQIREYLQDGIENNMFPVGKKLPSESELMRLFGVSRITVRQAIEALTHSGLVEKRQGTGAFVSRPKITQELNVITGWTETMRARGMEPETRAFFCSEVPCGAVAAQKLCKEPSEPVYYIERLRYCGGEPICIMKNRIPVSVAPGLNQKGGIRNGIYDVLEGEYGLVLATAVETIGALAASSREAEQLRVRRGYPLLNVERVTFGPDGKPIELVTVASVADRYAYTIRLEGRPQK